MDAPAQGFRWAADNDAFNASYSDEAFVKMLEKITGLPGCLFVVAPDVVGDAGQTHILFHNWYYRLHATGQPIAYVAQDGIERPPWDLFDALFIGGSTEFKLSSQVALLVAQAKQRGKWVHMGRVNTRRRVRYAQSIGCDSIDGTNFSMYRRTNLPWALEMCAGGRQGRLVA